MTKRDDVVVLFYCALHRTPPVICKIRFGGNGALARAERLVAEFNSNDYPRPDVSDACTVGNHGFNGLAAMIADQPCDRAGSHRAFEYATSSHVCYKCGGKGFLTPTDDRRNRAWAARLNRDPRTGLGQCNCDDVECAVHPERSTCNRAAVFGVMITRLDQKPECRMRYCDACAAYAIGTGVAVVAG